MAAKTKKLTITVPEDTLRRLRRSAKKARARSLSSYITEVVEQHEDDLTYAEYLDTFEPTAEDQVWADKALGVIS